MVHHETRAGGRAVPSARRFFREDSPSPPPPPLKRQRKVAVASPDRIAQRWHKHLRSGKKTMKASASSSVRLFERKIYGIDRNLIRDGLRLVEEKAAAVRKVMKEEERELVEMGRGVALTIQDEEGKRYSVFMRRRCVGGHYLICGGGWTHFTETHQLLAGDVLHFCFCRAVPRESSGKLFLGVSVVKHLPLVAAAAVNAAGKIATLAAAGAPKKNPRTADARSG